MALYSYKSITDEGKVVKGVLHASNALELEQRILNVSQELISYTVVKPRALGIGAKKLKRTDLINMVFQLEQLTKSGVPLLDGLRDLRDSAEDRWYRDVLASIVESIVGGKNFSEALKDFPNDFDVVFVSLISVGEESGELPRILFDMGKTMRWVQELVSATFKIMMYPAIVALVVFAVTAFLMIYLVPQIIPFVEEMGSEIPMHTKALIYVSDLFVNYWWLIFGGPIVFAITLKQMAKTNEKVRYFLDSLAIRMPLFGIINFKIKLARLANYMALLYASGITVLRALEICKGLMNNVVMEEAVERVSQSISDGVEISEAFKQAQIFPPLVIRMVRVGESTGNLDEALLNVSGYYNREVQDAIDKIEPAISPILTVIMGGLLGWIMMSVLGPVWDAIGSIN